MAENERGGIALRFPDAPARIRALPLNEKGFPMPFFADSPTQDAPRDIRVASQRKVVEAVKRRLCWICGQPLGAYMAFCIGPMCALNRTNSEPPSHRDCAVFAAVACPFLSRPMAKRSPVEGAQPPAGIALDRNPGCVAVWITKTFKTQRVGSEGGSRPGILFNIGEPKEVLWFAEGRQATLAEVQASVESGLPALRLVAERQGPDSVRALGRQVAAFEKWLAGSSGPPSNPWELGGPANG